jgi:chemotaxis response regulator CheB
LNAVRVAIADMDNLMRQILEDAIRAEPDMILAGHIDNLENWDLAANQLQADVVITIENRKNTERVKQMLVDASKPILFVIRKNGRQVTHHAVLLNETVLDDVSLPNLVDALRAAAKDKRG